MSPFEALSLPSSARALFVRLLKTAPGKSSDEDAIRACFSDVPAVRLVYDGDPVFGAGGNLVIAGGHVQIEYPADGTGSYPVEGFALCLGNPATLILRWAPLGVACELRKRGDKVSFDVQAFCGRVPQ